MGSDSSKKGGRRAILRRLMYLSRSAKLALCLVCLTLAVVCWKQRSSGVRANSFSPEDTSHLPSRCLDVHRQFHACQNNHDKMPVVLACHRTWCHSYGHCEPCAGIGDRSVHMLSLAGIALNKCVAIQLDYPLPVIQLVQDAIYHDSSWFPELLHKRSYDVSSRTVDTNEWGKQTSFVHFTPDNFEYPQSRHGACLFHTLFRPAPSLQKLIDYHYNQMGPNAIGIHFRAGDMASFGFDNKDLRSTDIGAAFEKMLSCAKELADKLFPPPQSFSFFLATDNSHVKEMAASYQTTNGRRQDSNDRFQQIYITNVQPSVYLRSDGERDAWLELYLLSKTKGLVVNVRPKIYEGNAGRLSLFSLLAKLIGFIPDHAVKECVLD